MNKLLVLILISFAAIAWTNYETLDKDVQRKFGTKYLIPITATVSTENVNYETLDGDVQEKFGVKTLRPVSISTISGVNYETLDEDTSQKFGVKTLSPISKP